MSDEKGMDKVQERDEVLKELGFSKGRMLCGSSPFGPMEEWTICMECGAMIPLVLAGTWGEPPYPVNLHLQWHEEISK